METIQVTFDFGNTQFDCEVPLDVAFSDVVNLLIRLQNTTELPTDKLWLGRGDLSGTIIRAGDTLREREIVSGELIELEPNDEVQQNTGPNHHASETVSTQQDLAQSGADAVSGSGFPFLVANTSADTFVLKHANNPIGRGTHCVVNVQHLPRNEKVSRHHANIIRRDDRYIIYDEQSTHGTLVNGHRLQGNERVVLKHRDTVQLGEEGIALTFFLHS